MKPLSHFASNVTSYSGEDGILAEIFCRYGSKNMWCVEFGARDGIAASNTYSLIKDSGWKSLQIESNHFEARQLRKNFADNSSVYALELIVEEQGPHSLDVLFETYSLPIDLDLLVIDIDSYDYQLWKSLVIFKPRVVMIEYSEFIPASLEWIQKNKGPHTGSSLRSVHTLGAQKGYTLVYAQKGNAIFIDTNVFEGKGIAVDLADIDPNIRVPVRTGTFIQGYDGTFIMTPDDPNTDIAALSAQQKYVEAQIYLYDPRNSAIQPLKALRENRELKKIKELVKNSMIGTMLYPLALTFYRKIQER